MSSRRTCFDVASDCLQRLRGKANQGLATDIDSLKLEVTILKNYFLFAEKRREQEMTLRINDVVSRIPTDVGVGQRQSRGNSALLKTQIDRQRANIKFLWTDLKEPYINLLDQPYEGDLVQLMDLFDSLVGLLESLGDVMSFDLMENEEILFFQRKILLQRLMSVRCFIANFFDLATKQGVDQMDLTDLSIQVEMVAVNATHLICTTWFERDIYDQEEFNKMHLEFSQVLHKIKPVDADPQVRQTYVHVLEASKLPRPSTHIFSPEKDGHIVAANFIDSLLGNLMDLLESYTTLTLSMKFQMQELNEGLRFLGILLGKQHNQFNELDDEMKDRIGRAFMDAGIVVCSLSVNHLKEGLSEEIDLVLSRLLGVLKSIMQEVAQIYPPTTSFSFPKTNELCSYDFLLKNLQEQASCDADSIASLKDQIHLVLEDLVSLRSFLEKIAIQRNQNQNLQALWNRVMEMGCKAEVVIDSIMVGDQPDCFLMSLDSIMEEIESLMTEANEICESVEHDVRPRSVAKTSTHMPQFSSLAPNEVMVGLKEEVKTAINDLIRGASQLDIVSIVGMPGIGKTTLARKVYNDPLIRHYFHIVAWCTVSQVYSGRSLLLQILSSVCGSPDGYNNKDEDDMAEVLYRRLKKNRYLIVLDDVWDIEALKFLKFFCPNDKNGSRILLTSRYHDLCSQFSSCHRLRLLTDEECWELLQNKLPDIPSTLSVVGNQIAKSCKGLPLTVVIVAGILANMETNSWDEVVNSLSSSSIVEVELCMQTLELSYRHLPDNLKSCLLYFGAFLEDQDIPVGRLLQLWISEGFVQKHEVKSLKDVAEEYLMDLIGRSLVMVTKERSIGGVKACQIHDLLHEFCVTKAKEERLLHVLHGDDEFFSTAPSNPHGLCIYPVRPGEYTKPRLYIPRLRSLLFFADLVTPDILFICQVFKLLRVLEIGSVELEVGNFPREVESLVYLRYLVIRSDLTSIPSGIAKLSRLETFLILGSVTAISLPNTIWDMKNLRHLCTWPFDEASRGFKFPTDNLEAFPDLDNLETLTIAIDPSSQSFQKIITKFPSIRRLKFIQDAPKAPIENREEVFVLHNLGKLESLRVFGSSLPEFAFPLNLKKLTLSYTFKPWSEISTIGKLPDLKVLKLLDYSFVGETWELKEGEFPNIKFLKLAGLDICWWTCSGDNFPELEKLVLHGCKKLEVVPSCLGETWTLKMIEVRACCESAIHAVERIQEEQRDCGNEELKIVIHKMAQRMFGEIDEQNFQYQIRRTGNFGLSNDQW